jgi:hypothetical protein
MKLVLVFLTLLLSIYSVESLKLSSQSCETTGQFSITLEAENKNKTFTDQIVLEIEDKEIIGEWDINFIKRDPPDRRRQWATFYSEEGIITDGGNKLIKITYPLEFDGVKTTESISGVLECPKFLFSCALLNIKIDECYTEENVFYGYFFANGFEQTISSKLSLENNLEFNLFTEEPYVDITNRVATIGAKPKKASVKRFEGEKYVMEFEFPEDNFVERFRVGLVNIDHCLSEEYSEYDLKLGDVTGCGFGTNNKEEIIEEIVETEETIIKPEEIITEPELEDVVEEESYVLEEGNAEARNAILVALILAIGIGALFKYKKKFT